MAHNTGNPIGSTSPKDLADNTQNLDLLAVGEMPSYPDRNGVRRKSWNGMEREFDDNQTKRSGEFIEFLESSGFELPIDYTSGLVITRSTQVVRYEGELYRARNASLSFTTTTWAADQSKFFAAGDAVLRQELADPNNGSSKIPSATGSAESTEVLRGRTNKNQSFIAMSPAGNGSAFANYSKTGIVVPEKAGVSEPPYIYDAAGNEYIEKRPISFQYIPETVLDETPKLVALSPFNAAQVLVALKKKDVGYILLGLANNVTTNNADSLGVTGSDQTMRRIVSVQSAVSVVVGNLGTPVESGSWARNSLGLVLPEVPQFTSASAYAYLNTQANGASLTYANMTPVNGVVALSFLCSANSNPTATISLDGEITTVNLVSSTVRVRTFRLATHKDSVAVVITNASASGSYTLNFLGQNFSPLANWNGGGIDAWGYYRNTSISDYIISNSENDYTMKEYYTKIYGGGYHGGESEIDDVFKVDGVPHNPLLVPSVGRKISIESSCTISWAPAASPAVVTVRKGYEFVAGGYYCSVGVKGAIVLSELYSALFGAAQSFGEIEAPEPMRIVDSISNNGRLMIGRTSKVVLRNAATGQKIVANYTVHQNDSASQYGGAYVWRVDGTYNKLYYNIAHGGRLAINGSYACTKYEFH